MTDPELILKKLARIETCIAELRRFADPSLLHESLVVERFVDVPETRLEHLLAFVAALRPRTGEG